MCFALFSPGSINVKFIVKMKQPQGQTVKQVYETTTQAIITSGDLLGGETILDDFTKVSITIGKGSVCY